MALFSFSSSEADPLSIRDVLVIVVVGASLGVGYNALQLVDDPTRGLSWTHQERKVVKLEEETPAPTAASVAATTASATPIADPASASLPQSTTSAPAASTSSGKGAAPAMTPANGAAPATSGTPAKTPTSGAPAKTPTSSAPATSAPAATTPAAGATAAAAPAADLPAIPDSRDPVEVGIGVAKRYHAAGAALFVDARSPDEYAAGHIPGAINLPFDDVFKKPELAKALDAKGRPIFSYCDGGDCELSRSLAFSLLDQGQHRVVVFTDGMAGWNGAKLDVHKGAQP